MRNFGWIVAMPMPPAPQPARGPLRCADCGRPLHRHEKYILVSFRHKSCADRRLTGQLSIEDSHVSPS